MLDEALTAASWLPFLGNLAFFIAWEISPAFGLWWTKRTAR